MVAIAERKNGKTVLVLNANGKTKKIRSAKISDAIRMIK
jgi:hypothetical protein